MSTAEQAKLIELKQRLRAAIALEYWVLAAGILLQMEAITNK